MFCVRNPEFLTLDSEPEVRFMARFADDLAVLVLWRLSAAALAGA